MNTPNITARDIGKGNKIEIVRLIPNDIPSQTNWLSRNCLLLLILILDLPSLMLLYSYYKNHPNFLQICSVARRSYTIFFCLVQNVLIPLDDSICSPSSATAVAAAVITAAAATIVRAGLAVIVTVAAAVLLLFNFCLHLYLALA